MSNVVIHPSAQCIGRDAYLGLMRGARDWQAAILLAQDLAKGGRAHPIDAATFLNEFEAEVGGWADEWRERHRNAP